MYLVKFLRGYFTFILLNHTIIYSLVHSFGEPITTVCAKLSKGPKTKISRTTPEHKIFVYSVQYMSEKNHKRKTMHAWKQKKQHNTTNYIASKKLNFRNLSIFDMRKTNNNNHLFDILIMYTRHKTKVYTC